MVTPTVAHLEEHYADLKAKSFFPGLVKYMASGPVVAMVWEGKDAVKTGRVLLGATNPLASAPGTIRGDFAIDVGRNVCHGSDAVESAKAEIALWFPEGLNQYKLASEAWVVSSTSPPSSIAAQRLTWSWCPPFTTAVRVLNSPSARE